MITNLLLRLCFLLSIACGEETPKKNTPPTIPPDFHSGKIYKDMLSEHSIFYEPGTNNTVPLFSKSASSQKIYGILPCVCDGWHSCNCCTDIRIRSINKADTGCAKIRVLTETVPALETELLFNNQSIFTRKVTFDHTPPLCVPFPAFPVISLCTTFTNIEREGRNVKACINFDVRITSALNPLWELKFTCVSLGLDGFSFFMRPMVEPGVDMNENVDNNNHLVPEYIYQ